MKGRFYQALHVKWQRKLGAPKPGESFHELYDRARMLEQYEKQYSASVQAQSEIIKRSEQNRKTTAPRPSTQSTD